MKHEEQKACMYVFMYFVYMYVCAYTNRWGGGEKGGGAGCVDFYVCMYETNCIVAEKCDTKIRRVLKQVTN